MTGSFCVAQATFKLPRSPGRLPFIEILRAGILVVHTSPIPKWVPQEDYAGVKAEETAPREYVRSGVLTQYLLPTRRWDTWALASSVVATGDSHFSELVCREGRNKRN